MPLPSVLNGATRCQVTSKRSKQRCNNPAAYGCTSCRMHGAHKSRNVLKGVGHPNYINGNRTKDSQAELAQKALVLRYLIDIGNHVKLFYKDLKPAGRPPADYVRMDLDDPEQLVLAILKTLEKK